MIIDANQENLTIGVVGAGTMGRGIAQVAATGGCEVFLFDTQKNIAKDAANFINQMLDRAVEKGRMTPSEAETAHQRIRIATKLDDLANCPIIIEAVSEDLNIKRQIFADLESIVKNDTILASNTSSLSVTLIAASCSHPERIAGMHFFNPVPLMRLVEIIEGARTKASVSTVLFQLGQRMGRVPVRVGDAPGFLVNQISRGYTIESAHLYEEGVASYHDIDGIFREGVGFRMGPFELMDLTGLDTTHPATEMIYSQFYQEPRFRPSLMMSLRKDAGLLGRKSKQGFYSYAENSATNKKECAVGTREDRSVWISDAEPEASEPLRQLIVASGGQLERGSKPSEHALILVTPIGEDATTAIVNQNLDSARTLAVDPLFGIGRRITLMRTPITSKDSIAAALELLSGQEAPVTLINDSPGFVAQRVIAMMINISCAAAQAKTATPTDIDQAVTLGLGYPYGPLAWGDKIGPNTILQILQNIYKITGDPRYRPTSWLRRRALLGVSLLTPDG